jgi:hypothetical protein
MMQLQVEENKTFDDSSGGLVTRGLIAALLFLTLLVAGLPW